MDRSVGPLSLLGAKTSAALEAYSAERERAIEAARQRFLEEAPRKPERAPRSVHSFAAVAFVAATLLIVALVWRSRATLEFTADGRSGGVDSWVAAPIDRPVALDFSDGSAFLVQASSRARVVALGRDGATIALENGGLYAEVVHRPDSAWNVIAGPLTVRVTGTRFALNWSASEGKLAVRVEEGSVTIAGAVMGAARAVKAGEALRVIVGERRVEWTAGPSATIERDDSASRAQSDDMNRALAPLAAPPGKAADSAPRAHDPPSPERATASPAPELEWRELIRSGSLRSAFAAAETSGFGEACRDASAAELLALGDGARLSGRPDRANQALRLLRSRYPSDPRRAAAAFALGKVAFDEARDFRQAAEWFSISVREQPGGSLSREARGRLLEALQRAGDAPRAKRAAEEYLERHPTGPHAALARSILR
jgi:TolA-binding protein